MVELEVLIHRADLDGLVRLVDNWSAAGNWAGLLQIRDAAKAALASGRQLWPVAILAEYRLALHAPAEWAAAVLDEGSGRFTIGPLTEVVAQNHSVAELAPYLDDPVRLGLIAHERARRGDVADVDLNPLDIPVGPAAWEPQYPLATYTDAGVEAPSPAWPNGGWTDLVPSAAPSLDDPEVTEAVRQLLDGWTASSDGHVEVRCVEGNAADAVGALGVARPRLAPITLGSAMSWLTWAGANGGAHGRRRGTATGRFGAWWLLAQLCDLADDWPPDATELGRAGSALSWYWWDAREPMLGWTVQLAVADEALGCAWAISAHDAA